MNKQFSRPLLKKYTVQGILGLIRYFLIIGLTYLILAPILHNLSIGFTHPADLGLATSIWIPARTSIENWYTAMLMLNYRSALPYTFLHTAVVAFLQIVCSAMAGYAFARLKFRFREVLFGCVILTILVPPNIFMLPQYLYFKDFDILGIFYLITGQHLNLLNNPVSIYIMAATGMGLKGGLFIYIFRQTFRGLPKALEEAAYIDGAGFVRTFTSIVLPSSGAGMITVAVLSFVWNWNDAYFTNLFDNTNLNHLMLAYTRAAASVDEALNTISRNIPPSFTFLMENPVYEAAIAKTAAVLVFVPLVVLYLIVQRKFVQGVERSGLVG
ncbi:MAG: carbohydrate ABC transporter permease [Treponema sp.]